MDKKDCIAAVGLVLIVIGVGLLKIAAAFILAGLMLFAYAFLTTPRGAAKIRVKASSENRNPS